MATKNLSVTAATNIHMKKKHVYKKKQERMLHEKLASLDSPLIKLNQAINWNSFHVFSEPIVDLLAKEAGHTRKPANGREKGLLYRLSEREHRKIRRYSIMMIKLMILQHVHNYSDDEIELEITDRTSYRQFLGIDDPRHLPGRTTITLFRKTLERHGLLETLFRQIDDLQIIREIFLLDEQKGLPVETASVAPTENTRKLQFPDSNLAHELLDNLWGVEIGGSAHNSFHLPNCLNIDYCGEDDTIFKRAEIDLCGSAMKVDIVSEGDDLPFKDNTLGYVISSHVIEHYFDPIKALKEWHRVIKPGGYIFTIAPHVDRVPEEHRGITPIDVLINRHLTGHRTPEDDVMAGGARGHHSVFNLDNFLEMCAYLNYQVIATEDPDKKVGNGFTVVIQK